MELFALIVKQDERMPLNEHENVVYFLKKQIMKESVNVYMALFDHQVRPVTIRYII